MADLAAMARRHQPGLIIADRTVGGDFEDFITPEQEIPDEPPGVPWESCITLGHAWKYVSDDKFKSAADVIRMLADTAAKGGNLLLGVGPDPLGRIPAEAERRLAEIGQWLRTNGEAIYGTRPLPPYRAGAARFTRRGDTAYAIVFDPLSAAESGRIRIRGLRPAAGTTLAVPGGDSRLAWQPADAGFEIGVPARTAPSDPLVLRFTPDAGYPGNQHRAARPLGCGTSGGSAGRSSGVSGEKVVME